MSKFFDKIRTTAPGEIEANENVERWLQTIHANAAEQPVPLVTPRLQAIRKSSSEQLATFVTPLSPPALASLPELERGPEKEPGYPSNIRDIQPKPALRKVALPRDLERTLFTEDSSNRLACEAYRTIRTRLIGRQSASGISTVVVTSAAPGEGKTLTTLNLGLCCTRLQDSKVLVVDGDLRTCGITSLLRLQGIPGVSDVLAERVDFADAVMTTDVPNFYFLGAGTASAHPSELLARTRWRNFLAWAKETFKLVLIDSPPMLGITDFELISCPCDAILAVARANKTNQGMLKQSIARIDPKKLLGVVLNAAEENSKSGYAYYS